MPAFFLLLFLTSLCSAQPLTWQDIAGTAGYGVLLRSSTGRIFATNRRGVIYSSIDNGGSFSSILAYPSATPIVELALDGNRVAVRIIDHSVTNSYQILLWNNQPHDWRRIFTSSFSFFQSLMINDSGVVFAVDPFYGFSAGRIVRFDGTSWSALGGDQQFLGSSTGDLTLVNAVDHANNFVVGSAAGGIYVSTDYGQTWRSSLPTYSVSAIDVTLPGKIFIAASPSASLHTFGGLFASTDSGQTWQGLGLSNHSITSLAARNSGSLCVLADGEVYKRIDSTGVWRLTSPAGRQFTSLVVIGADTIIASSEATGTFRSTDDGATWAGAELRGRDVFAITTSPSGELFAGTLGSGIFRSSEGAPGWTQAPPGSTGEYVYAFAVGGGTGGSPGVLYAGTNRGVYRTTDDGASWGTISSSLSGSTYAVALTADGALLAGTGFGIYRSVDTGITWSPSGLAGSTVFLLVASPDGIIYAGTAADGVYSSTDAGVTWAARGLVRNDLQTLAVDSAGHLFAGVHGGIFRSTDQGSTWENSAFTDGYAYALLPGGTQTIYAGTYHGLYRSSNDGGTWSAAGDSGLAQNFVLSLAMSAQGHILAGTYRGAVYRSLQQVVSPIVNTVDAPAALPLSTRLFQNYPNPFNPRTDFRFGIRNPEHVSLRIYDILGREIASLVDEKLAPGTYSVSWDASGQPSAVYYYRLIAGTFSATKKMLLVR